MSATFIDKQPSEEIPIAVSFINRLPVGETLQGTSTVTATNVSDGSDASALLGTPEINNPIIAVKFSGGAHGNDYKVTFLGISQTYKYEYDVYVQVRSI